jgi:hypothetical protein
MRKKVKDRLKMRKKVKDRLKMRKMKRNYQFNKINLNKI